MMQPTPPAITSRPVAGAIASVSPVSPITPAVTAAPVCHEASPICQAMMFAIAQQQLALPLSAIHRVIRLPRGINPLQSQEPFIIYGGEPVQLVNPYPLLARLMPAAQPGQHDILILAQLNSHQRCAVLIDAVPQVINLPLAMIHPLPASNRYGLSQLADHVAILSINSATISLFLLNLQKAQAAC